MVPAGLSLGRVCLEEFCVPHKQSFPEGTTVTVVAPFSPCPACPAGPAPGLRAKVAGGFLRLPQHLSLSRIWL